eukprot:scaffold9477_cov84-Skeletonema_dohrnii-CCMP3373.AAC.5
MENNTSYWGYCIGQPTSGLTVRDRRSQSIEQIILEGKNKICGAMSCSCPIQLVFSDSAERVLRHQMTSSGEGTFIKNSRLALSLVSQISKMRNKK